MRPTGKVRTLRGQITAVGGKAEKQLILNDQLINRGLRVTGFFMWPEVVGSTFSRTCNAILSYAALASGDVDMDAGDNTQLGWAFYVQDAKDTASLPQTQAPAAFSGFFNQLIDPDHIINRDLFISLRDSSTATFNYMVVCEFLELTDDEAIVTIIKENSQSIE
jgi:hypothetical protein